MNKYSIEIKWGFLFVIALILWMVGEKNFGLHDELIEEHAFYTSFFAIVAIGIYLLALYDKRRNYYAGKMDWKRGFFTGLKMTAVIVLLSPLAQYIISIYITPEYFENVINYTVEKGDMTTPEAEEYFSLENYIFQSTVWALMSGVLTSAFAALLMRKRKN